MKDCLDDTCLCASLAANKLDHVEEIQENLKELERGSSDSKRIQKHRKKEDIELKSMASMVDIILSSEKRSDNNCGITFNNFEI